MKLNIQIKVFSAIRGLPGYTQRLWRRQGRGLVILLAQGKYRVIMRIYKEKKTMDEKADYSDPTVLAQTDTAIEIMAGMRATRITRLALEKMKPEQERDDKLMARLERELQLLNEERHLMYQGDRETRDKILNEYSKEMKEYLAGKKNDRGL